MTLKRVGVGRKSGFGVKSVRLKPSRGLQKPRTAIGPKKTKVWGLKRADSEFRAYMLKTVPIRCAFPDCPITDPSKLTVSHYHGRVNKGTRFVIANCDFLCRNHHYWDKQLGWEFQKQTKEKHGWNGRYTLYMRDKLGAADFLALKDMAESGMKPKLAIKIFQEFIQSA